MSDYITVSIVVYNTIYTELEKLLECVISDFVDLIYIVDNSEVNTLSKVDQISDKIIYLHGQGNIGYGSAHNIAINKAIEKGSTYHVILNPDVYFSQDVLEKCHGYLQQMTDIGLLMPKILYPSGEIQYLCKLLPTPFDLFARRFIPFERYVQKRNDLYELKFMDYETIMEVPSLSGCFMFIRTEVLERVGGFDEQYFMYAEDLDLCRKISEISKTVYYPLVSVYHEYAKESYKNKKLLKYHIQSLIKYFNKWGWFFDKKRSFINKQILNKNLNK